MFRVDSYRFPICGKPWRKLILGQYNHRNTDLGQRSVRELVWTLQTCPSVHWCSLEYGLLFNFLGWDQKIGQLVANGASMQNVNITLDDLYQKPKTHAPLKAYWDTRPPLAELLTAKRTVNQLKELQIGSVLALALLQEFELFLIDLEDVKPQVWTLRWKKHSRDGTQLFYKWLEHHTMRGEPVILRATVKCVASFVSVWSLETRFSWKGITGQWVDKASLTIRAWISEYTSGRSLLEQYISCPNLQYLWVTPFWVHSEMY